MIATHHAAHVQHWIDGAASDLSTEGFIALLERALSALWRGATATLGEITLTAIVDRVLYTAAEQYPFLAITKIRGATGFEVRPLGDVQRDRRLRDVIHFVLAEFLSTLGNLTDEIVTPALHNALATVRRDERDTKDARDDAAEAGRLLDLASIDSGRLAIQKRSESAIAIVEEAIDGYALHASRKVVWLEPTAIEASLEIECDRGRILQVLGNLIGNAIEFSRAGGTIEVRAERRGSDVLFSIAHTGPGISPNELPHVFDRYLQTRETAHLGTGLGLSIAKLLVLAHAGRIWADSVLGRGATFFFTLPALGP